MIYSIQAVGIFCELGRISRDTAPTLLTVNDVMGLVNDGNAQLGRPTLRYTNKPGQATVNFMAYDFTEKSLTPPGASRRPTLGRRSIVNSIKTDAASTVWQYYREAWIVPPNANFDESKFLDENLDWDAIRKNLKDSDFIRIRHPTFERTPYTRQEILTEEEKTKLEPLGQLIGVKAVWRPISIMLSPEQVLFYHNELNKDLPNYFKVLEEFNAE